jgi:hypothetical protein
MEKIKNGKRRAQKGNGMRNRANAGISDIRY